MHITLFGGTFDPPHNAHLTIAHHLIDHQISDQVWFVPVFKHPWAQKYDKFQLAPYHHRTKMIKLLIDPLSDSGKLKAEEHKSTKQPISTTLKTQNQPNSQFPQHQKPNLFLHHYRHTSFTYSTIRHFEKKFPQHTFSWVMGSEYISRFHLFLKDHPKLKNYTFYIYPRQGYPLNELSPVDNPPRHRHAKEYSPGSPGWKHGPPGVDSTDQVLSPAYRQGRGCESQEGKVTANKTLNPQPSTLSPQPSPLNPLHSILYPFMKPLKAPIIKISSTQIRQNIQDQKPISTLVSPQVESYINTHNLYNNISK